MLTLLLVCSFSPKVQKYLLGSPYFIAREALFRSNKKPDKICRVFVAKNPNFNRNYFKGVQLKVGGGAF